MKKVVAWSLVIVLAYSVSAFAQNKVIFDNQSGEPALVKLIGPTQTEVEVPNGGKVGTDAAAGRYVIKVRYGTPGNYRYNKGDEFPVTEKAAARSETTITLHKVVAGNYDTQPISETDFAGNRTPPKGNENAAATGGAKQFSDSITKNCGPSQAKTIGLDGPKRKWKGTVTLANEHSGKIRCMTFACNGKTLATAGDDTRVVFWDVLTATKRAALVGHQERVTTLAFSPSNQHLASGDRSGAILVWSLNSNAPPMRLSHENNVLALAFSPDGKYLASGGGSSGTVKMWDVSTGRMLKDLSSTLSGIFCLDFSPDNTFLGVGGQKVKKEVAGKGELLDIGSGASYVTFDSAMIIQAVMFSPDRKYLIMRNMLGRWGVLDVANAKEITVPTKPLIGNSSLNFSTAKGSVVVYAIDEDGELHLYSYDLKRLDSKPHLVKVHERGIEQVVYSPDGEVIAIRTKDGTIKLLEALSLRDGAAVE